MYISMQEETLLSYFVGLAPLGAEIGYISEDQMMNDLRDICTINRTRLAHLITGLCEVGALKRISRGYYTVHKRPEDFRVTWKTKELTSTTSVGRNLVCQ